jgi:hypothetical protein
MRNVRIRESSNNVIGLKYGGDFDNIKAMRYSPNAQCPLKRQEFRAIWKAMRDTITFHLNIKSYPKDLSRIPNAQSPLKMFKRGNFRKNLFTSSKWTSLICFPSHSKVANDV